MAIDIRSTKSGERRYIVRVKDAHGRRFPAKTFLRRIDAERFERQIKREADVGQYAVGAEIKKLTFRDYFLRWHRECRHEVSEGWRNDQLRMAHDFIFPIVGQVPFVAFAPLHVGQAIEHVRRLGKSEQVVMHVYNTLHKAFEDAVHHYEWRDSNPVRRRYKPRVIHRSRAFLSPAESTKLLQATRENRLGPAIWLSLLAGLRPSEVMALRVEAVNLDLRIITIKAAYKRKVKRIEPYPKQANWGRAVMPPVLTRYLSEQTEGRTGDAFVASPDPAEMLSYHVFYKGLRAICKKLGLRIVTPHELRHSSTELLVEAGASPEDLRRQLNHSSLVSTKAYIHRSDDRLRQITDRIEVPSGMLPVLPTPSDPRLRLIH